ncbi:MAG TPA: hypothetical protein VFI25_02500 [Planctomycetota bacterium]|jgi:hypothetical protein|nr:hypothetical protein [Planctomycetota bacterium]
MGRDRPSSRGGASARRPTGERKDPETEVRHEPAPPKAIERSVLGAWRIEETEVWARDAVELLGPARIDFGRENLGTIRLVAIEGSIDFRISERDGAPFVEFSWSGYDDADPACGRGWAVLRGERLTGKLFIHRGDESTFVARRTP